MRRRFVILVLLLAGGGCESRAVYNLDHTAPFSTYAGKAVPLRRTARLLRYKDGSYWALDCPGDVHLRDEKVVRILPPGEVVQVEGVRLTVAKEPLQNWTNIYILAGVVVRNGNDVVYARFNYICGIVDSGSTGDLWLLDRNPLVDYRPAPWEPLNTPSRRTVNIRDLKQD